MDSIRSRGVRNPTDERNADDLFHSLISLVKDLNTTPPKEGYRDFIKPLKIKVIPPIVENSEESGLASMNEVDALVEENSENSSTEGDETAGEFDPSKYFGSSSFSGGKDSDSKNLPEVELGAEYYTPISFDSPTLSITPKTNGLSQQERFEMLRELKSIKRG